MTCTAKYYKRWEALKTERTSYWAHWKDISDYLLPRSGRFFIGDRNRGTKRHNNIRDSSGTRALRVLAAGLMSGMTSPARPWFRMQTANADLNKVHAVKVWCEQVTRLMHRVFQSSNTYLALHSVYEELGAFGTAACIVVADFDNVIHHYPLTVGEYAIAVNWKGEADTLYREFERTVAQVVAEFGIDNVSPRVKNLYDLGKLDAYIRILHCIEPRDERDMGKKDTKNMPFASVYLECGGDGHILRESGFKRFPVIAPRWALMSGEVYGSSPAMDALGDIKQLQHEQLSKSQAIDYQVRPPLQMPASMRGSELDLLPGGMTYVAQTGAGGAGSAITTAFDVRLDINGLAQDIQSCTARINSSFYADLFLALANRTDIRMTATEVAALTEEKMLMLGPVLERLQHELLDPLIEMTFEFISEAGLLPPPPEELQGQAVNVELVSMLAQAQRAVANNSTDRFVARTLSLAQAKPEVLDRFDADYWAESYSDAMGLDPSLIVPIEVAQQKRADRAQANAVQAQSQMQAQAAATAVDAAKAQSMNPTAPFSGYTGAG